MSTASIKSSVVPVISPTTGLARNPETGVSREDLVLADVVTLESVGIGTAYQWNIAFKPEGSTAVLSSSGTTQGINRNPGTFTVDKPGPYLIRLLYTTRQITVNTVLAAGVTFSINGITLTAVAGARTSGSNDFSVGSGTVAGITADMVAAITDAANSFVAGNLAGTDASPSVIVNPTTATVPTGETLTITYSGTASDVTIGNFVSEQYVRLRALTALGDLKLVAAGERYDTLRVPVDATASGWADNQNYNLNQLLSLVNSSTASTRVLYVDPTSGDFQTIQAAMDRADTHPDFPASVAQQWVVLVRPGTYVEDLTFYEFVHVFGWPGGDGTPLVTVRNNTAASHSVTLPGAGSRLSLCNLRFERTAVSATAVITQGANGKVSLFRCEIEGSGAGGSYTSAGDSSFTECGVIGGGVAVTDYAMVFTGTGSSIDRCTITGQSGISLTASADLLVRDTQITTTGTASLDTFTDVDLRYCQVTGPIRGNPTGAGTAGSIQINLRWSQVAAVALNGTAVAGTASLTVGSTVHGALTTSGGAALAASVPADSTFYDNTTSGITAANVQAALDEIHAYAELVRTLDNAYDGGVAASGSGRTIIADSGSVQIVDAAAPSDPIPAGNTNGNMEVVGSVKLGALTKPEITVDPNPFGNGPEVLLGKEIWANDAPLGSTALLLGDASGNPTYHNYNLRVGTQSADGGNQVGSLFLRAGDALTTINAGSVYIQGGTATNSGGGLGGHIYLVPGETSAAGGVRGVVLANPVTGTSATLTASGAFSGAAVAGKITLGTELGGVEVTFAGGENLAAVHALFNATKVVTAAGDPIVLTTVAKGPSAEVFYLNAAAGVDAALGTFSGQTMVAGTWPQSMTIAVTASDEITFGLGDPNPMLYNSTTGKLTVPGLIDPTGMIFDEAAAPATGAGKGAIYVSNGVAAGETQGDLYFKPATGALVNLTHTHGADTLTAVLAAGNTTGANDISVNTGQKVVGQTVLNLESTGAGNGINLTTSPTGAVNVNTAVVLSELAAAPSTGASKGAIFVSDGTGSLDSNKLYYVPENNGSPVEVRTGPTPATEALAPTLAVGNTTGGANIVLSTGDKISGAVETTIDSATGDVNITSAAHMTLASSGGAFTVNSAGTTSLNSSANLNLETTSNTHAINLGSENKNGPVNIGTNGSRTITMSSANGAVIVNGPASGAGVALTVNGDLNAVGLISRPTGLVFDEAASAPSTGASKGAIFVSDGTGSLNSNTLYYVPENNGTPVEIRTGPTSTEALAPTLAVGNTTGGANIVLSTGDKISGAAETTIDSATGDVNITSAAHMTLAASGGAVTVNAAGYVAINSAATLGLETTSNTHAINVGADNKNGPVNIGTNGSRTITMSSANGAVIVNGPASGAGVALTVNGDLNAVGLISRPTGLVFDEAASPTTGAGKGAIFVSDGTSSLVQNSLYFQPATGSPIRIRTALDAALSIGNTTGANDLSVNTGQKITSAAELTLTSGSGNVAVTSTGGSSNVSLTPGASGEVAVNGKLNVAGLVDNPTGLVLSEAAKPATGANKAAIFVSNTTGGGLTQNKLYYVNSAGTTTELGAGGASTLQAAYNGGAGITTAGASPIAFTVSTAGGGFQVDGNAANQGLAAFGSANRLAAITMETAQFAANSTGVLSLLGGAGTVLQMNANDTPDRSLDITANNAGSGAGNITLDADDVIHIKPGTSLGATVIKKALLPDYSGVFFGAAEMGIHYQPVAKTLYIGQSSLVALGAAFSVNAGTAPEKMAIITQPVETGAAGTGSASGQISIQTGQTTSASNNAGLSGAITLGTGNTVGATGGASSGGISLQSGTSRFLNTGTIAIVSGATQATSTGSSGSIDLTTGVKLGSGGNSGLVRLTTGNSSTTSGNVELKTGTGTATRGHLEIDAGHTRLKEGVAPSGGTANFGKIHVDDGAGSLVAGGLYFTTPAGTLTRLDSLPITGSLDRHHINMPEAPNSTVLYKGWAAYACTLAKVKILCATANTQGTLILSIVNNATTNTVLNSATINLNDTSASSAGVLSDDTVFNATLTSTASDLTFAENARWTITLTSNDPNMDAAGIYIDLSFEVA